MIGTRVIVTEATHTGTRVTLGHVAALQLAAGFIKALKGSYKARLEKASMRFFDGKLTTSELHAALVAAFGADGRWS